MTRPNIRGRRSPTPGLFAALPATLVLAALLGPTEARGQGVLPTVAGGAAGLVSGGVVSVGVVTVRARQGEYLDSVREALGWQSAPILLGTVGGAVLGSTDRHRLGAAAAGALAGWFAGGGLGYLMGRAKWDPPEGKWAGLAIGGASGLVAGAVAGYLLGGDDGGEAGATGASRFTRSGGVTLGLGFRF